MIPYLSSARCRPNPFMTHGLGSYLYLKLVRGTDGVGDTEKDLKARVGI